jgi:RHS repeat-associated protein
MRKLTKAQIAVLASTLAIGTVNASGTGPDENVPILGNVTVRGFSPVTIRIPGSFLNTGYPNTSLFNGFSNTFPVGNFNADAEQNCDKAAGPPPLGNPIIPATGNKIESEDDFSSSGEMPLALNRTYNHHWQGAGLFGKHWVSTYDYKLTFGTTALNACFPRPGGGACGIGSNTTIFAWRPDGKTIRFLRNASDGVFYEDKPSPISRIVKQADGSFVLYVENKNVEVYSSAGYISSVRNEQGIGWTYSYTGGTYPYRVTHTSGRYVEFVWTTGRLTSVRDPAGNYYGYAYTANAFGTGLHRLSASSRPGNPTSSITYHYEKSADTSALTGKSFNGIRYSTFGYNVYGYATSTEHSGQDKYTLSYTAGANGLLSVLVTNPLGKAATYTYQDGKSTSVAGSASTYCGATQVLTEYDANGYVAMHSDANNNKTAYTYDSKGRVLTETEAYGTSIARRKTYVWDDANNRMVSVTLGGVGAGTEFVRTSFAYGATGRVISVTTTNLFSVGSTGSQQVTTYAYTSHPNGMLATVIKDGPVAGSGDQIVSTYDSLGNLVSVSNSLGHATTYSGFNGLGQPGRMVGPNGEITDYTYDARGRVVRLRTYPDGATPADKIYAYSGNDTLSSLTPADGIANSYGYDAALRLISVSRSASGVLAGGGIQERQTYSLNSAGDNVSTANWAIESTHNMVFECHGPLGAPQEQCLEPFWYEEWVDTPVAKSWMYRDYDELSRVRSDRGNNGRNVRRGYDANGNVVTVIDSLNRTTTYGYDALNRVIYVVDPANGTTSYEYNVANKITKLTDPRGKVTTYSYDGFGQPWSQTSPDTGTTSYTYSTSGLQLSMTQSGGAVTSYGYDGLGRMTSATANGKAISYIYDSCNSGKSRLCAIGDSGSNDPVVYGYTPDGRLAARIDYITSNSVQSAHWTHYYYDAVGRLNSISYPSGIAVGYGYASGKLAAMTVNVGGVISNVITGTKYRPFGPTTGWTYGNGLTRNLYYDQNYNPGDQRLTGITTMNGGYTLQSLLMTYNVSDQVSSITNYTNPSLNSLFKYDSLDRLIEAGPSSTSYNFYNYDANGNRTADGQMGGSPGVLIPPTPYTIDPNSNRLTAIKSVSYSYNSVGNLAQVHSPGYFATNYEYDGFNRLVGLSKWVGSGFTPAASYAYNGLNQRISKVVNGVSTRFIHASQNQIISEETGGTWTSYLYFAGELVGLVRGSQLYYVHNDHLGRPEMATNASGAVAWKSNNGTFDRTVTIDSIGGINLGFPGQYYDEESGLWHNGFRDYDPKLGRYIQSDPVGLAAGTNPFLYASGNPISRIDDLGLRDVVVAIWNPRPFRGQVGHVFVGEMNGQVILSQFPTPHGSNGVNTTLNWQQTLKEEGRPPDNIYKVFVKDDAAFDKVASNMKKRPTWDWWPSTPNETNCVYAADAALDAGGLPTTTLRNPLPAHLNADLSGMHAFDMGGVTPLNGVPWAK